MRTPDRIDVYLPGDLPRKSDLTSSLVSIINGPFLTWVGESTFEGEDSESPMCHPWSGALDPNNHEIPSGRVKEWSHLQGTYISFQGGRGAKVRSTHRSFVTASTPRRLLSSLDSRLKHPTSTDMSRRSQSCVL